MELVTALLEEGADSSGPRMLLMDDDGYFFGLFSRDRHGVARYSCLVATTRRTGDREAKWHANSTSISTARAPGPISLFTPSSRSQPSFARRLRGSPPPSAACPTP